MTKIYTITFTATPAVAADIRGTVEGMTGNFHLELMEVPTAQPKLSFAAKLAAAAKALKAKVVKAAIVKLQGCLEADELCCSTLPEGEYVVSRNPVTR